MVDTEPDARNHIRAVSTMVILDLKLNVDRIALRFGIRRGDLRVTGTVEHSANNAYSCESLIFNGHL